MHLYIYILNKLELYTANTSKFLKILQQQLIMLMITFHLLSHESFLSEKRSYTCKYHTYLYNLLLNNKEYQWSKYTVVKYYELHSKYGQFNHNEVFLRSQSSLIMVFRFLIKQQNIYQQLYIKQNKMQQQDCLDQPESHIFDQGSNPKDKKQEEKPISKKAQSAYEFLLQNYKDISIKNKQLKHENRNLFLENESLKQQSIDSNSKDLKLQCVQQKKQLELLQIQTVQNQHLWWANSRHIQEISRYIQLLEYKQQYINQLELKLKQVSEKYKLTINKDDIFIPDDLVNKSFLNNDDKYFVDEEYKKQKDHQAFKKRYKRDLLKYQLQ
ncbi:hypothetical protein pb186bvf_004925 [Paramecium bursaria]